MSIIRNKKSFKKKIFSEQICIVDMQRYESVIIMRLFAVLKHLGKVSVSKLYFVEWHLFLTILVYRFSKSHLTYVGVFEKRSANSDSRALIFVVKVAICK